ncbi:MAG: DinB family protein [Dehalococcoidia bacterium]
MPTAPDPLLASAHDLLRRTRDDMRVSIQGLPAEALNWRPVGDDTNSIAVLAYHSLTSTITWLSVAVDEPPPGRDRDSDFDFAAGDDSRLLAFVDESVERCLDLVDRSRAVDWAAVRNHWDPARDIKLAAAWAFVHALEHLREHEGQMSLTRQLWEQRSAP